MEKLFIPSFPKTCLNYQIPTKVETSPETHPTKSRKKSLSFTKKKQQPNTITPEDQLDYLCRNGTLLEAEKALDSMFQQGGTTKMKMKRSTYLNLLESCIDSGSVHLGRILHARFGLFLPQPDVFVETKLLSMYAKCGCLADARKVFDSMRERNLYTWSAMIGAYSREHRWREVSKLFVMMMEDGVLPDDFLFPKILQGCANCGDVETGKLVHSVVVKLGMTSCLRVSNSILAVYAKCGELGLATKFFRRMEERDVVAWNSVLLAYCQNGKHEEAVDLVEEMEKEGISPGLVTWNILIGGYNQLGKCDAAMDLMQKMENFGVTADVFTWTAMISGLIHNGKRYQALDTFRKMFLAGVVPNGVTIMSAVSACSCLKILNLGSEVHSIAVKMGFMDDLLVGNSLVDMYSKCGKLEEARKVFDSIKNKDVYTWNSMITGYCQAEYCGKAYELFMRMQEENVKPNIITWNTMISGYIQNGDEGEAMDLFQRMEKDGKVQRSTASWNLIIAGYIQNGKKDEALELFRKMQFSRFMPNSVTILSLLPACANLLGARMVREIHGCVLRRNLDAVHAVKNALIDTYAKSGDIGYARTIFKGMKTKDIITWNSLIGGYVLHGSYGPALDLFDQMKTEEIKPNRGTLSSIILAHGLMGNVDEGKKVFSSIANDYHIIPALEHCCAMVSLYGRSNRLEEALQFIQEMNVQSEPPIWESFLTACRIHGDIDSAIHAAEHLFSLEPETPPTENLVSQIYALGARLGRSLEGKKPRKEKLLKKPIGQSWIEVRNLVHTFTTGDQSKLCTDVLYPWVEKLCRMDDRNDQYNGELLIEEEGREETCGIHSEKFAMAFGLISPSRAPKTIRILKNLRMCRDCHNTAKYISKRHSCKILLEDTRCLHHFKNGDCSCKDYW
ncbi:pentatricopeptide repeat-containing protein At1g19720 [Raphanus sativus]|uniref:Pentatricopeptide repeat-containing protein At1g19720 n=1 Tax=Raphanus sativus TaxID=3726 RepID=A0A6J0P5M9_RAPSA|nr:pentatricopeptide repeat-containing protein At1g19720 [Raphanus sativus]